MQKTLYFLCWLPYELQAEWITKETLIEHFPDEVIELNEDTYKTYPKKNPKRNVLVMFYVPKFEHTQLIVANYFRHAFAFRVDGIADHLIIRMSIPSCLLVSIVKRR